MQARKIFSVNLYLHTDMTGYSLLTHSFIYLVIYLFSYLFIFNLLLYKKITEPFCQKFLKHVLVMLILYISCFSLFD